MESSESVELHKHRMFIQIAIAIFYVHENVMDRLCMCNFMGVESKLQYLCKV